MRSILLIQLQGEGAPGLASPVKEELETGLSPALQKKKKAPLSPLWRLQEAQPLKRTIFHTEEHFSPFRTGGNLPLVLGSPSATPHLLSSRAAHSLRVSCKISFLTTATPAEETRYVHVRRGDSAAGEASRWPRGAGRPRRARDAGQLPG